MSSWLQKKTLAWKTRRRKGQVMTMNLWRNYLTSQTITRIYSKRWTQTTVISSNIKEINKLCRRRLKVSLLEHPSSKWMIKYNNNLLSPSPTTKGLWFKILPWLYRMKMKKSAKTTSLRSERTSASKVAWTSCSTLISLAPKLVISLQETECIEYPHLKYEPMFWLKNMIDPYSDHGWILSSYLIVKIDVNSIKFNSWFVFL